MKNLVTVSILPLLLLACSPAQTGDTQTDTPEVSATAEAVAKHSGILTEYMDLSVRPGSDFNAYVNGGWASTATIPSDRAATGVGLMVHEQSQDKVKAIIEESASGTFPAGSDEQKVGDLYASYMNMENRNTLGATPLDSEFSKIQAIESYEDLATYFAEANKIGIDVPFALGQYVDFKDPTTYMIHTWQGGLGLPDREYYFEDGEKSETVRAAYLAHIEALYSLAGLPNAAEAAQTIMALETRMAATHMKKEDTRDMVALYNRVELDALPELMPNFAWDQYLAAADADGLDFIVVTQMEHMKALDPIITETSLDDWKTYLTWQTLDAFAPYLSEAISAQNFDFNSKTLWGVEQQLPLWKRAVGNVNGNIGEIVGKVYVARHFPPEAKAHMLELVGNLNKAYKQSIEDLDWMTEETKVEALDKLSKFTPKIGYPDVWKDYSALEIAADDLVGNMQRSALFVYESNMARQGGEVDKTEWSMTPQTVNAYYNPPLNEIVFPAAILQPPYFDLNAEDAVNYGAIGAVIGHEIGHGFDDSGSTFDGDGVLRNWWTEEDKSEFKKRTALLVDQYSEFQPFEDLNVNGEFTLGENIGDLGGLSIALKAYELSLDGEPAPEMDGFTGQQRVFIGYGQAWRTKMREEAVRSLINTDPHSPAEYRVNGVVRNVPEFYEAFDVSEEDALYLSPKDRVKIW